MRRFATVAITCFLFLSLASIRSQDKTKTDHPQGESTSQPSIPQPPSSVVQINIGGPDGTNSGNSEQQEAKTEAKPFMTHGEYVISFITTVYVIITFFTFRAIKRQAKIAQQSANSQMASEAAWIMVDIEHTPGYGGRMIGSTRIGTEPEIAQTHCTFRINCVNRGKTPAWIGEKRATFIITKRTKPLPKNPDLDATRVFQDEPEPLSAGETSGRKKDETLTAEGYQGLDDWAIMYGVVKYRDIFGRNRQTTFGYRLTIGDQLERLPGYPKYNENT